MAGCPRGDVRGMLPRQGCDAKAGALARLWRRRGGLTGVCEVLEIETSRKKGFHTSSSLVTGILGSPWAGGVNGFATACSRIVILFLGLVGRRTTCLRGGE